MNLRTLIAPLAVTAALGLSACAAPRQYVHFKSDNLNGRRVVYDERDE